MAKYLFAVGLMLAFAAGTAAQRFHPLIPPALAEAALAPTDGWTLHIDAQKHFGDAHPDEIAHHWCKRVSNGLMECQIYDSDAPDARLVAVETIVAPAVYRTFSPSERALWHYHKVEIPKVHATLPGMSAKQAAKVIASIADTYGKVWVLWDPMSSADPVGMPTVSILR